MTPATSAFAGLLLAASAGCLVGALWYGVIGRRLAAPLAAALPAVLPFLVQVLLAAWLLLVVARHLGSGLATVRTGLAAAGLLWVGAVLTATGVNAARRRRPLPPMPDAALWLVVLLVMGGVIGWWRG